MISSLWWGRRAPTAFVSLLGILALPLASMSTTALSPFSDSAPQELAAGLDPSTASGARKLYQRIHRAALQHCGGRVGVSSDYRIESQDCYRQAIANTESQIEDALLFTHHRTEVARLAGR